MRTKRINGKDIPVQSRARRPRKITDPAKLAREYETHTAMELADMYNVSLSTITRALRAYREAVDNHEKQI